MARWIVSGLIALNLLLALALFQRLGFDRPAYAQLGGNKSYVAVAGYSVGDTVVYVLEVTSGRLVAIRTSSIDRKVTVSAGRNITADFARVK